MSMVVVVFEMRQDLTNFYLNDCCINWEQKNIGHSFGCCRSHDAFSLNITSIHWQTIQIFKPHSTAQIAWATQSHLWRVITDLIPHHPTTSLLRFSPRRAMEGLILVVGSGASISN